MFEMLIPLVVIFAAAVATALQFPGYFGGQQVAHALAVAQTGQAAVEAYYEKHGTLPLGNVQAGYIPPKGPGTQAVVHITAGVVTAHFDKYHALVPETKAPYGAILKLTPLVRNGKLVVNDHKLAWTCVSPNVPQKLLANGCVEQPSDMHSMQYEKP
jgi:hypothetical protein